MFQHPMHQERQPSDPRLKWWKAAYTASLVLASCCLLGSFSLDLWPNLPTTPRPETGHIYGTPMHGVTIYWTEVQYWLHHSLLILAMILGGVRVLYR